MILGLGHDQVMGFVHEPSPAIARSTAVLICPPFGWAEMTSYRGRRTWAQSLANSGYWTVRFDLPSAGDSAGSPRDPGRMESWTNAVGSVAAWLRRRSGATRLVAIGIELGGVLACCAVAQGAPIEDLILWAVPSRGGRLLRELRASGTLLAGTYPEDDRPGSLPEGDLQLTGYLLTEETASALDALRLTSLELPPVADRRAMLIGRDGLGVDDRLRDHFSSAGVAVTVADESDYADMMIHPQQAVPPLKTIATTVAWLDAQAPTPVAAQPWLAAEPAAGDALERDELELAEHGTKVRETPLQLRAESGEFVGVISTSSAAEHAPLCVVLLNGGMVRRIGPNRTWVEIARRWAARGVPVVRIDLEGIGDSDGELRRPLPDSGLYQPEQTDQTLSILAQLAAQGLPDRFLLLGLCSGAYWGFHAALADPRVVAVFALNLYCFFWDDRLVLERDRRASVAALRHGLLKRVLSGRVQPDLVRRALRSFAARPGAEEGGRSAEQIQVPEVEQALDQLRDQNTELLFLFSQDEPLFGQLERTGVLARFKRWPNATIERIPSRDHMFHQFWLQQHVHESLDRNLERILTGASLSRQ